MTEPVVFVEDIRAAIARTLDGPDESEARKQLAEAAGCSKKTIDRIMRLEREYIALGLADNILVAAGEHLSSCRVLLPDGTIE